MEPFLPSAFPAEPLALAGRLAWLVLQVEMELLPVRPCQERVAVAVALVDLAQLAGAAETAETTVQAVAVAVDLRLVLTREPGAMVRPAI